ncbi:MULTISPECIES: hypothetical protein [Enterobacteriaceae]|uniref:hypothetical protein n=1 Tax=Enterobacteriaceae TaxID=543 RepID=UPI001FA704D5|nr:MULTISPECIES: hypothetical protein [Enterobacteriaceae]MCI4450922.1 hypothetical protein [Klebsiella variicola]
MRKKLDTSEALRAALNRIINGQTTRISKTRKLSIRSVEEEANLGNGSSYYYPEVIEEIISHKKKLTKNSTANSLPNQQHNNEKFLQEKRIKDKYKKGYFLLKNSLAQMATEHHHLNDALRKALASIDELEKELSDLRNKISDKDNISYINVTKPKDK